MCPRHNKSDNTNTNSKRQERDIRQQEKKARGKQTYLKDDENVATFTNQLRAFNLQLRDIIGDGNCLFRSCKLFIKSYFCVYICIEILINLNSC